MVFSDSLECFGIIDPPGLCAGQVMESGSFRIHQPRGRGWRSDSEFFRIWRISPGDRSVLVLPLKAAVFGYSINCRVSP